MVKRYIGIRYNAFDYTKTIDYKIKNYIEFSIMNGATDNTMKNHIKKEFGLSGEMANSYIMIMRGFINGVLL
jgi:hypothetical protein